MFRHYVLFTALLCFMMLLPGSAEAKSAPERTVEHIQQAIQRDDLASFEQYVAVDALVDNSLDVLMAHLQKASLSGADLPPTLAVMAMAANTQDTAVTLKKLLRGELVGLIRYSVSSGLLNGEKKQTATPSGMLAPFLDRLTTGPKTLRLAGKARTDGSVPDAWLVPVVIRDNTKNRDYPFTLRILRTEKGWQADRIADLDELLTRLERQASAAH